MNAKRELTAERVREVLTYVAATGEFKRRQEVRSNRRTGTITDQGYLAINIDGRCYKAHRLAWLWLHGQWPALSLDHINGDRLDNRAVNLREATPSVNRNNVHAARKDSKTGRMGVTFHKKKTRFRAVIYIAGKRHFLGTFADPDLAHAAYLVAKRKHHEGFQL